MVSTEGTHPAFRLAEKHFKNRTTNALPALRNLPEYTQAVLDLSGPPDQTSDPVWQAGWWGAEYTEPTPQRRRRKGKERAVGERGERPVMDLDGVPCLHLKDGRTTYLVAEARAPRIGAVRVYPPAQPLVARYALRPPPEPVRALRHRPRHARAAKTPRPRGRGEGPPRGRDTAYPPGTDRDSPSVANRLRRGEAAQRDVDGRRAEPESRVEDGGPARKGGAVGEPRLGVSVVHEELRFLDRRADPLPCPAGCALSQGRAGHAVERCVSQRVVPSLLG
ncbi:hypothetical protein A1Q1_04039 [Trichosporon asahii var. asahii CBS 2479]|uniref:Uncharacterized protein n=1 Tax=Trichosporon asahii var. asahii (strain ATCC 90039 / CBS 2479 / JCM 2466 / KCTC 7840 / NBRC 103889/ NCYC 2677 / UAMH 7654) TaxID=1186058 RepID=J5SRT0_TRIAS|nr:hypothetical protein A1Q1_04039 [Trichosporon asahii var. asahii CBS 2479]EJT47181.1 hypothetical protein A1Q1_04039 [Trichosporon asahii var. asahii CBS 2479]